MVPTVTTVPSVGEVSRLTSGCSAVITDAAATTGSVVMWGMAPWPPRPLMVRKNVSAAAIMVFGCVNRSQPQLEVLPSFIACQVFGSIASFAAHARRTFETRLPFWMLFCKCAYLSGSGN